MLDALFEEHTRAVEVPAPPMMEADADLEDPVIQAAVGRSRSAPEELERLVLLEELAAVELLDRSHQLRRRRLVAARANWLVDRSSRDALRGSRGLAVAARRGRASSR
jgi:hypothetical protein